MAYSQPTTAVIAGQTPSVKWDCKASYAAVGSVLSATTEHFYVKEYRQDLPVISGIPPLKVISNLTRVTIYRVQKSCTHTEQQDYLPHYGQVGTR